MRRRRQRQPTQQIHQPTSSQEERSNSRATGMESGDEELNAVLQCHRMPEDVSLAGLVGGSDSSISATSSASSTSQLAAAAAQAAGVAGGGRRFREGARRHAFSPERRAMLGPEGALPYSNSPPDRKPGTMSVQTMNPFQEQGGQSFGPSAGIPPKTGVRRQGGLWAAGGGGHSSRSNFAGPRNGEAEMDTRLHAAEYPSAVLDQGSLTGQDPFRPGGGGGGLARYHSAPSSFLAGLAADFQQDSALSSFFADADLPSLNPASDSSMDTMDAEQSTSNIFDDKFLLDIRKFERIGNSQLGQSVNSSSGGAGLVSQKALQSGYKPSMEVLHENSSVNAQMASTPQMSSGLSSAGLCMPSTMGLVQQATAAQQMNLGGHLSAGSPQGGQQQAQAMSYGNLGGSGAQGGVPQVNIGSPLSGNMNFSGGLSSDFGGGTLQSPGGRSNNLLRQTSSPAGLLAQLSIEAKTPSPSQLPKTEKQSHSSPLANSPDDSQSGGTSEDTSGTHGMMSGLDVSGWEDAATSYMKSWGNDTFSARKRFRDNMDLGDIMVSAESPGATLPSMEHGPLPGSLTRHMSLPSSKSKIGIPPDDLLQSVPCRIRAKRGCATHPRSIAERVRRTRISERMRKLQELVPNMDKQQTNTADMLDEAVEYVKQLQRQVQELTESQAKCNGTCHQDRKNAAS